MKYIKIVNLPLWKHKRIMLVNGNKYTLGTKLDGIPVEYTNTGLIINKKVFYTPNLVINKETDIILKNVKHLLFSGDIKIASTLDDYMCHKTLLNNEIEHEDLLFEYGIAIAKDDLRIYL